MNMGVQDSFIKQHGYIEQQQGLFAVRIRTIAGILSSFQLRKLADLSDKYGSGQLHVTTRQSVEIYGVPKSQLNDIYNEARDLGLLLAFRGPKILTVIACLGAKFCKKGFCDTIDLATQLDVLMVGKEQAGKTKIALSGCPNSCAKPQINDIGLHGAIIPLVGDGCIGCNNCVNVCKTKAITVDECVPFISNEKCIGCGLCVRNCPKQTLTGKKQGYTIYVGGKIGKKPMLGNKVFAVIPEQEAISYIDAILCFYNQLAYKGERIGDVINRIGLAGFQQEIVKWI